MVLGMGTMRLEEKGGGRGRGRGRERYDSGYGIREREMTGYIGLNWGFYIKLIADIIKSVS